MPASTSPARCLPRPFAVAGLIGLSLGLSLAAPSEAAALSCESSIAETLELELSSVSQDGVLVESSGELSALIPLTQLQTLMSVEGDQVRVGGEDFATWLDLQQEIEPTAEVAAYISAQSQRSSGGLLCSGVPYLPLRPGVFVHDETLEADFEWPEGASLTLDAERESATFDFVHGESSYTLTYAVVDFYFPGDEGGCSVSDEPPGPLGALALLACMGLGCRTRRRGR